MSLENFVNRAARRAIIDVYLEPPLPERMSVMQIPHIDDFQAATATVIGPDAVLDAREVRMYAVYDGITKDQLERIIEANAKCARARGWAKPYELVPFPIDERECGCILSFDTRPAFYICQEHRT